jgi:hypothetical protein
LESIRISAEKGMGRMEEILLRPYQIEIKADSGKSWSTVAPKQRPGPAPKRGPATGGEPRNGINLLKRSEKFQSEQPHISGDVLAQYFRRDRRGFGRHEA